MNNKRPISSRHFNRIVKQKTSEIINSINENDPLPGTSYELNTVYQSNISSQGCVTQSVANKTTSTSAINHIYYVSDSDSSSSKSDNYIYPNTNISDMFTPQNNDNGSSSLVIPVIEHTSSADASVSNVANQLRQWAIEHNITHSAMTALLKILTLTSELNKLPKDARTFFNTPRKILTRTVNPGSFYHLGFQNGIQQILKNVPIKSDAVISVAINIDGLPLSKSSGSQLYPILCIVTNFDISKNICVVGLYHGYEKPSDFNNFIQEFVDEAVILTQNGIEISGTIFKFKIKMLLFDAVAKASILYIKGHSGYFSCTKCKQEGDYIEGRVCFPEIEFTKLTDIDFMNQTVAEHHTGTTYLKNIPEIGLVTDVPLDYMHLLCLGVVKRFLVSTWCFGSPPHKLPNIVISKMSEVSQSISQYIPCEFVRKSRCIKESKRWKATEFRLFLLYTGPIILKNNISRQKYDHFLTLHVAVRILLSEELIKDFINYADSLLIHFVKSCKIIYGSHFLTHNIHNLLHLVDDAKKFGTLDKFSNFSSENYLQILKKMLRKPDNILPQIVRRISEINNAICETKDSSCPEIHLRQEHNNGILIKDCSGPQCKELVLPAFKISLTKSNSCCGLKNGNIIEIENIAYCCKLNSPVIIGREYTSKTDFYKLPCLSSFIKIYTVKDLSDVSYWPITDITIKFVRIPWNNEHVVFPLLHI